jgi:dUTP pyrophosphatase
MQPEEARMLVKVKKLYKDSQMPVQGHPGDAGCDVFVHRIEDKGQFIKVCTGIAIEPAEGYWFELVPRSSLYKRGCMLYNSVGIIDSGYRGEIIGILWKTEEFVGGIGKGDRLLQLVPRKLIPVEWREAEKLGETSRGGGGYGSTGTGLPDGMQKGGAS